MKQLLRLPLRQPVDGNAGPGRDNAGDIVFGHLVIDHAIADRLGRFCLDNGRLDAGNRLIVQFGCRLVVAFAHGFVEPDAGVVQLRLQVTDARERSLFGLPSLLEFGQFRPARREVCAEFLEPGARRLIFLLLERDLLDAQSVDGALELVDLDRA